MRHILLLSCLVVWQYTALAQTAKRKLVFDEEFDYTGLPDPAKWGYEKGFVREKEPQYYTEKRPENCRVENGMLIIEGRKENYPNPNYKPGSDKRTEKQEFAPYTSASINTLGKYSFQYGRIEVRAKLPAGAGIWPAIWMMGDDHPAVGWPKCGEIDIMEYLGRQPTNIHTTIHYADSLGKHQQKGHAFDLGKPVEGFHVYAMDWDATQISFYYDDIKLYSVAFTDIKGASTDIFKKKYYLLLNLALGSPEDWGGPQDDSVLPARYYVDYVRVYQ